MMRSVIAGVLALGILAPAVRAQGTLSAQGFGYPTGELSTRAAATGGALAPFDPVSPVNPAALSSWGGTAIYFQYSPEFRSVSVPGGQDHTTISRFPLAAVATSLSPRLSAGVSMATFLDRTWGTSITAEEQSGSGESSQFFEDFTVRGAINDIRLALAYQIVPALRIGVSGHVLTGDNRLDITRNFVDTAFADFSQHSTVGYSGNAVGVGLELRPVHGVMLAADGRIGGKITATTGDTTLGRAWVPNVYGGGVEISAVPGLLLAGSAQWTGWSHMRGLGQGDVTAFDGWDWGVGAEGSVVGAFGRSLPVRAGFRRRTLPFGAAGRQVTEKSASIGLGIPFGGDRSRVDLGLQRAWRSIPLAARERAWIISAAFFIRP
ncbi:MAG TPA: hypothetical protein VFW98_16685 [Gemmatimonadaceae bacterium]|nr:hypothetical protein [Gemmatimonadaceae bacterium]